MTPGIKTAMETCDVLAACDILAALLPLSHPEKTTGNKTSIRITARVFSGSRVE
jgi:hypothetical protein